MPNQQHAPSSLDHLPTGAHRNFDLQALLQETAHTLSNLDFEYRHELERLEGSRTDPALKKRIVQSLIQRHRERREPYVKLIAELQRHAASASLSLLKVAG